jgi:hypothetical protein
MTNSPTDTLSDEVVTWLAENNLTRATSALTVNGFSELEVIKTITPAYVSSVINLLKQFFSSRQSQGYPNPFLE